MKKGINVYAEKKSRRYCVRINKKLTGTPSDPKKRFAWRDYLPPEADKRTATQEQWHEAKKAAKVAADAYALSRAQVVGTPQQVALALTPFEATDALAALALLKGCKSLVEVTKEYMARHFPHRAINVKDFIKAYLAALTKKNHSKRSFNTLAPRLRGFLNFVGPEAELSGITGTRIQAYIDSRPNLSNNSFIHYHKAFLTLFRWAVKNKYLGFNPAEEIELGTKTSHEIGTLTPQQMLHLLEVALSEEGSPLLAAIVLAGFCGIRREELQRLTWADINFPEKCVKISVAASKTSQRRMIKIRRNVAKWLRLCPNKSGKICPTNFGGRFTALVKKAGFVNDAGKSTFPRNALRHNFGSYLYAAEGAAITIEELGHSSPKMVKDHYLDLKYPIEGKAYFSICPKTKSSHLDAMLKSRGLLKAA